MSRKDTISHLFLNKREIPAPSKKLDEDRVRTGAIGAMGATLKEMAATAKQATDLQRQLEEANSILEIDPQQVDQSRIADRLSIEIDPAFDSLVESIKEDGQQVPVLLRPCPSDTGRYQIAYGRRRLRAAQALGIKIKAIVKKLTDDELIVAQGRENLDRQDLSFIEKAFFAKNMEDDGIERSVVISALGMDKSDVSRLISVATKIPDELIRTIGPAPKAGRKRWMELLDQLENPKFLDAVNSFIRSDVLKELDSDQRFAKLMAVLRKISVDGSNAVSARKKGSAAKTWTTADKSVSFSMHQKPNMLDVSLKSVDAEKFGDWLSVRLEGLYEDFRKTKQQTGD